MSHRGAAAVATAATAVALAGCATTEDAQEVYASSRLIEPDVLFVQYGDSGSAELDGVEVRKLSGRRLGIRVRVRTPFNGQEDDLVFYCVRVQLDEAARPGTTVVGWDGAPLGDDGPRGGSARVDDCPRRDAG